MKTIPIPGRVNAEVAETEYYALKAILGVATWQGWGDIDIEARNGHVVSLAIVAGNLKAIPPEVAELKYLERLDLGYNDIAVIEHLDGLSDLRELNLMANSIASMHGIEKLVKLEKLTLFLNLIEKIEHLDKLTKLRHLDLNSNCIKRIENLDKLKNLRFLYLHDNAITRIENLDAQKKLEELTLWSRTQPFRSFVKKKDFRSNAIKKVENIAGLTELKLLDLANNQISSIECELPVKLSRLIVSMNPIVEKMPAKWRKDKRVVC